MNENTSKENVSVSTRRISIMTAVQVCGWGVNTVPYLKQLSSPSTHQCSPEPADVFVLFAPVSYVHACHHEPVCICMCFGSLPQ